MRALALACLLSCATAWAHGTSSVRLARLQEAIARSPRDARLYLQRGELHRAEGHPRAALYDYRRAAKLARGWTAPALAEARLLVELGRPREALRVAPREAAAWRVRGQALALLRRPRAAAAAYTRAIAHAMRLTPEHFLEAAGALRDARDIGAAVALLDEGLRRLGGAVTLELFALELDLERRNFAGALARIERQAARAQRPEPWLLRKAEVLRRVGRAREARSALAQALAALQRLPASRRAAPASRALELRIREGLRGADVVP